MKISIKNISEWIKISELFYNINVVIPLVMNWFSNILYDRIKIKLLNSFE